MPYNQLTYWKIENPSWLSFIVRPDWTRRSLITSPEDNAKEHKTNMMTSFMVLIRMRTEGEVITFLLIGMGVGRLLRIYLFAVHLIRYIWVFVIVNVTCLRTFVLPRIGQKYFVLHQILKFPDIGIKINRLFTSKYSST